MSKLLESCPRWTGPTATQNHTDHVVVYMWHSEHTHCWYNTNMDAIVTCLNCWNHVLVELARLQHRTTLTTSLFTYMWHSEHTLLVQYYHGCYSNMSRVHGIDKLLFHGHKKGHPQTASSDIWWQLSSVNTYIYLLYSYSALYSALKTGEKIEKTATERAWNIQTLKGPEKCRQTLKGPV